MLPYIVLVAAAVFFIIRGIGWLDDLADRRGAAQKSSSPWQEVEPSATSDDRRLEVFREFLDPDRDHEDPSQGKT
jgi:hypothetical protein